MKAHELLSSPDTWCQDSPAKDAQGNKVQAFDPNAVKWCALTPFRRAILRRNGKKQWIVCCAALSVSEKGISQLTKSDKACSLMEWNDERTCSFREIREVLVDADV